MIRETLRYPIIFILRLDNWLRAVLKFSAEFVRDFGWVLSNTPVPTLCNGTIYFANVYVCSKGFNWLYDVVRSRDMTFFRSKCLKDKYKIRNKYFLKYYSSLLFVTLDTFFWYLSMYYLYKCINTICLPLKRASPSPRG